MTDSSGARPLVEDRARYVLAKAIYEVWCPTETHLSFEKFCEIYPEQTVCFNTADEIIARRIGGV